MGNRTLLLRFATTNLDKAKQALKEAKKLAREGIKQIKDPKERKQAREEQKSRDIKDREILDDARDRQRGERRSRGVRRRARRGFVDPLSGLNSEAFIGGPQGLIQNVLGKIPGFAPALAGGAALLAIVKPIVEQEFRVIEQTKLNKLRARLDRLEADSFARRIREDVVFQAQVGGESAARNRVLQDAQASKRIVKSSRLSRLSELG
tara:strand:- start:2269 stop:2889 length:621 start_codon:yes stop_codon:yes gene_type:complete